MRRPRFRIRTLMIAVAVVGLALATVAWKATHTPRRWTPQEYRLGEGDLIPLRGSPRPFIERTTPLPIDDGQLRPD